MEKIKILNLLYLEIQETLSENNKKILELIFNKVCIVNQVDEAIEKYKKYNPDIIIVDDRGKEFIKYVRNIDIQIPIILLSESNHSDNLLDAINLQVDGYILKPIFLDALTSCLNNCVKKIKFNEVIYIDNDIFYNIHNKELFISSKPVKLGKKLNSLLFLLLKNNNKIVSKDRILYEIWDDYVVSESSIKNLIGNLRKIIGKDKIINVPGFGWRLEIQKNHQIR